MKKHLKQFISFILVACLMFVFVGCGNEDNTTEANSKEAATKENNKELTKLEKIKEDGKLVIGTSADYPPYEFHNLEDGKDEIVGFDIAIAKIIAKDLGVELEIKDMGFDGLLPALKADKVDIIIAGMTPTEDRKKSVDFSKVYYTAVQKALVSTENKDVLKSVEDLTGKKIGVQRATIQEEIAKEQIKDAEIKALTSIADLVMQLKSNKIDAVIAEGPVSGAYAKNIEGIEIANIKFETEDSGSAVAINKGNEDLVEAINSTLDRLIEEKEIEKFVIEAIELSEKNQK